MHIFTNQAADNDSMQWTRFLKFKHAFSFAVVTVILSSVYLRFYGITHALGFHPDERGLVMITDTLSLTNLNPKMFAYGSLPFYLLSIVSFISSLFLPGSSSYDGLFMVGRFLSVAFSVAIVGVIGWLGFLLGFARSLVLILMALVAWNPFFIQNAHFYTVDTPLTFFCVLTITLLVKFYQLRRPLLLYIAAAVSGLAMATKISALGLFLPLVVVLLAVHIQTFARANLKVFFLRGAGVAFFAFLAFACTQPYALLDFRDFYHDISEQAAMVAGREVRPYTVQYISTLPFIYPLQQMFSYTVGPLVFLCAITGLISSLALFFRKRNFALFICWLWCVAVFLAFGGQQVKFPRYMLIIYPTLFLFAVYALDFTTQKLPSTWRKILIASAGIILVGSQLFSTLAFMRIYRAPHVWTTASNWMYKNLPEKANLLGEHWDDRLPIALPGFAHDYFVPFSDDNALHVYETDSPEKIKRMAEQLTKADFIVLPTARAYAAMIRNPNHRPLMYNYYQRLFGEELGYTVTKTFSVTPRFAGFQFDDSLADESLTVYDHPKVIIFKNERTKSAQEITDIISKPIDKQLALADIMRISSAELPTTKMRSLLPASTAHIIIWYLAVLILGVVFWRVSLRMGNVFADRQYGIAKILGLGSFALAVWMLQSWFAVGMLSACLIVVCFSALGIWLLENKFPHSFSFAHKDFKRICQLEIIFALSFAFCLFLKSWRPEIFSGEKPMDFTFLNFFARDPQLPPQDPWAADHTMRYYYFGSYLFGLLCHLFNTPTAVGYNLALCLILPLSIVGLIPLIHYFVGRWRLAIAFSILIAFGSNWDVIWQAWITASYSLNFDLFWASSRVFKSAMANEYPVWSFLFGDLHAHVIAVPFAIAFFSVLILWLKSTRESFLSQSTNTVVCSATLALLMLINTWDFLFAALLFVFAFLAILRRDNIRGTFLMILGLGLLTIFIVWPFLRDLLAANSPTGRGTSYVEANSWQMVMRHFGCFVLPIVSSCLGSVLLLSFSGTKSPQKFFAVKSLFFLLLSFSPIFEFLWATRLGYEQWAIGILMVSIGLAGVGAWLLCWRSSTLKNVFLGVVGLYLGHWLILSQIFWLSDYMNWQFKIFVALWVPMGVLASALSVRFYRLLYRWRHRARAHLDNVVVARKLVQFAAIVSIAFMMFGTFINMGIMTRHKNVNGPRPTLNGNAYLWDTDPAEAEFFSWLNKNVVGTPMILEAQGRSYAEFNRVGMHTGLPSLLGWEHHVKQRGLSEQELHRRREWVKTIYTTENPLVAQRLLLALNVRYVVVGNLEKATYSAAGLQKFANMPVAVAKFQNSAVTFYEIVPVAAH